VQFELTEPTRSAVAAQIEMVNWKAERYLFPSRLARSPQLSTQPTSAGFEDRYLVILLRRRL